MKNKKQLLIASVLIVVLCLISVILYSNNKAASDKADDTPNETINGTAAVTEHPTPTQAPSDELAEKNDALPTADAPTPTPEEEKVSFFLRYTDVEIFFEDCVCEYDKYNTQVYAYFVDDPAVEAKGYAVYIQTPDDSMEIFPAKDYRVDKNAGTVYMLWGDETFERIQGVNFVHDLNGFIIESTYSMETLIGEVYNLELLDDGKDFDNLQVEFTELYDKGDQTILCGTASALYNASGKNYDISWIIDTENYSISADAETYLSDLDIHPLYVSFLHNEISVANPYVAEGATNTELNFFDDREYDSEFDNPEKGFCLLDLTDDGIPELLFEIKNRSGSDRLLYILGIRDGELICYDIFETHTSHVGYTIYDNGVVESGYRFQDGEANSVYYRYNSDGSTHELIHFFRDMDSDSDLIYDYYYLEGNADVLYELTSSEEYESVIAPYPGELLEWLDCKDFADIPGL